jgi:hypothetical protein
MTEVVKIKSKKEKERQEHNRKVLDNLHPGDLVQYKRDLYSHWAVYIGHEKIIHLHGTNDSLLGLSGLVTSSNLIGQAIVKIDSYWDVTLNSYAYRNNSNDYDLICLPSEKIIIRAYSRVGYDYYNLFSFNCEHFAKWCRYDLPISDQSMSIIRFGNSINNKLRLFKQTCIKLVSKDEQDIITAKMTQEKKEDNN